jgi:hypothetical protein
MATVKQAIHEHDAVELLEQVGDWPAGAGGAVVSDYGDAKLVEVADDKSGEMLDLIQVPESGLKLVAKHSD